MDRQNGHDASHATTLTLSHLTLPLPFLIQRSGPMPLEECLYQTITFLVEQMPQASDGGILLREPTGHLSLRAHYSIGHPNASLTTATEALEQQTAILWHPDKDCEINTRGITSGIYLPILWANKGLGVIYLHSDNTSSALTLDHLDLPLAVAHYLALTLTSHDIETRLQHMLQLVSNFERLVGPQASTWLHQHRGRIRLGGDFVDVTIVSADIRGFTQLSAKMSPDDVTEMLDDYFSRLVPVVYRHEGNIDKFVGDQILAVFDGANQYLNAIVAALEMQDVMEQVNTQRAQQGKHTGQLGIGIHAGEVVRGFIGATQRMEYTVIGDAVNRACRFADAAWPSTILMSPEVFGHVFDRVHTEVINISTKHEGEWRAYRIKEVKVGVNTFSP